MMRHHSWEFVHLYFHIFAFRELAPCSNATVMLLAYAGSTLKSSPPRRCVWQADPPSRDVRSTSQAPAGSAAVSRACRWLEWYLFAGTCTQLPCHCHFCTTKAVTVLRSSIFVQSGQTTDAVAYAEGMEQAVPGQCHQSCGVAVPHVRELHHCGACPACTLPAATHLPRDRRLLCLHSPAMTSLVPSHASRQWCPLV